MSDQAKASKLARTSFDQWQAGALEQARLLYEEAFSHADTQHYALPLYHGEFACVLNQLGQRDLATVQLEKALAVEIAQGEPEGSPGVLIARYFLADQLHRLGDSHRALDVLSPSIRHSPDHWLTRVEEALILYALDRKVEARNVAALAVANAPTAEKAEQLRQQLHEVLAFSGTDTGLV